MTGNRHRPRHASLRARLQAHEPLAGTVISSPDPVLAERIAQAFDLAWIDMEHSALSVRDALGLAIALRAGGGHALVRLPRYDSELLTALLDAGVDGVVAPKIGSAAEAAWLVRALRYPPAGTRGFAPRRASAGRATTSGADPVFIVQIETRAAVEQVDEIAATDGVDGVVVGLADLSLDLGRPLDMEAADLVEAARVVGGAAARNDVSWGLAAGTLPGWIAAAWGTTADMLVLSSDVRLYGEAIDAAATRLRELRPVHPPTIEPGVSR
jgi:2-keto-3-deoxy-L-rhamnonate aldolase RhmA